MTKSERETSKAALQQEVELVKEQLEALRVKSKQIHTDSATLERKLDSLAEKIKKAKQLDGR